MMNENLDTTQVTKPEHTLDYEIETELTQAELDAVSGGGLDYGAYIT